MRRLEKKLLPKEINYAEISGLRLEAQEKLNRVRPGKRGTGRAYFRRFPGGYFRAVDLALCTQ